MRDILAKSDIPNSRKSPDIGQNSNGVISISGFWVHWRKLKTENCHKSRTSDDIERKLGPVTKLDKGNKGTSQNDYDVMSENCEIIAIFPIYGQFGAIQKLDSGRILCETYVFIHSKLLSYKNWKQN